MGNQNLLDGALTGEGRPETKRTTNGNGNGRSKLEHPIDISLVISVLDEHESLIESYDGFLKVLNEMKLEWEMVFVNDGSKDGSAELLNDLAKRDPRVKVVHHRRNYGKASAQASGFNYTRGKWIATADADLQQDPEDLKRLWAKAQEDYDLVNGTMVTRSDPLSKRLPSKIFNIFVGRLLRTQIRDINSAMKLLRHDLRREFIDYGYGEFHRYFTVLAILKGYKVAEVAVIGQPRLHGQSKFGFERYVRGFLDLINIYFFLGYMERPLHFFGGAALGFFAAASSILAYLTVDSIAGHVNIMDRPAFTISILLFLAAMQLFVAGLLAAMVRNLWGGSKERTRISNVTGIDRRRKIEWRGDSRGSDAIGYAEAAYEPDAEGQKAA